MAKRKSSTILFNPDGVQIGRKEWDALHNQEKDPYILKEFENDRVAIQLRATELQQNADDVPPHFWKKFKVDITNIVSTDSEGVPLPEPRRFADPDTRTFILKEDAITYYETFLAKYTDSKFDEKTGKLKEVGNKLIPPDPDVPVIAATSPVAEQFGSW